MTTDGGEVTGAPSRARVFELVAALEASWAEPAQATTAALARLIADREALLDELQRLDPNVLDPDERREIASRLDGVRARNVVLLHAVDERRGVARDRLEGLSRGRVALRGYRQGGAHPAPGRRPSRSA
ncbi:MAG TPA: hypothetical protein RMF84_15530 [Polyangiaceae bacterium LLY-WYZ-14_1]|nr:hypothetical protein [Polyangiaceae bacterium LLY-WYZ-14_1]